MQTKKRAKPVKFGKSPVAKVEKKETPTVVAPPAPPAEIEVKEEITVHKSSIIKTPQQHPQEEIKEVVTEEVIETPVEKREEEVENDVEEVAEEELVSDSDTETKKVLEEAEAVLATAEESSDSSDGEVAPSEEQESETPRVTSRMTQTSDSPFDDVPLAAERKKNPFLYFLIVAFATFFVGLAVIYGANIALENKTLSFPDVKTMLGMEEVTPTAKPTEEPTPTPQVDLAAYSINVLNGSGVTGEAAKLKTALTSAGFTVGSTGNADTSDYEKTQITVKKDVDEAYVEKLKEELEKSYQVDAPVRLSENALQDSEVSVTIGSETAQ